MPVPFEKQACATRVVIDVLVANLETRGADPKLRASRTSDRRPSARQERMRQDVESARPATPRTAANLRPQGAQRVCARLIDLSATIPPDDSRGRLGMVHLAGDAVTAEPAPAKTATAVPSQEETANRINRLVPSDLAGDVLAAVAQLGGEPKRSDIIDAAVKIGGWTEDELAVRSRYVGAARTFHLRTCADYAVTVCTDRGQLEAGAVRGHWRLTGMAGDLAPHPHDRVFTAAVGVAGDPVDDDWRANGFADEHGHIWFAEPSRQLSAGDHLFAIGVSRKRAVLGLFEVLSAGDLLEPKNPWDPERWPYAVAVRALAGAPPVEAVSVDSITTPRSTANRVTDETSQRALYAAMSGRAYEVAASAVTGDGGSLADRARAARRPRPFDPSRRPTSPRAADATADPQETSALREKAQQGHHDILVNLHRALLAAGWTDIEEIPAAIDLRAVNPSNDKVIFEAKTIAAGNEVDQTRAALAQLLEYRQEYGHPDDGICVVVGAAVSDRRSELLARLGVGVVLAGREGLNAQNDIARAFMSS
jgi:hypothetical protein